MSTLLMFLSGPMQSWGNQSRHSNRDTGLEPSKSGVIGLLCAALGRPRSAVVDDIATLRMGVRIDSEGQVKRDFHTTGGGGVIALANNTVRPEAVLSERYYLCDAQFLVGLEGNDEILNELFKAIQKPVWQIYLGRKSFVPGIPIVLKDGLLLGKSLEDSLQEYPWPVSPELNPPSIEEPTYLRTVLELPEGKVPEITDVIEERMDQPVGAAFQNREFRPRTTVSRFIHLTTAGRQ